MDIYKPACPVLGLVVVAALGAGCQSLRGSRDSSAGPSREAAYDTLAPLGSRKNPIRATMPFGQQEYLKRLVCPGGGAPDFARRGSVGEGADGDILDVYAVSCPNGGPNVSVLMDMYHSHRERRPVEGFTIFPELPARMATGCPPQAGPSPDSSAAYVFNYLEVATPARLLNPPPDSIAVGFSAYPIVGVVVDTTGHPEPGSIQMADYIDAKTRAAAERIVTELRFTPAEHHPGCRVREGVGIALQFY